MAAVALTEGDFPLLLPDQVDFRLDGFEPADVRTERDFRHTFELDQDLLTVLAEHHTPDGVQSYYVLHNSALTWAVPSTSGLLALHLQRDTEQETFSFEHAELPLPAMAQSWLIQRGCPREAIALHPDTGTRPADEDTRALEQRLVDDGDRFSLVHSYTLDEADEVTTLVVLRARDESDPARFRVLQEEAHLQAGTHSLREGGFTTLTKALDWCNAHIEGEAVTLPPVPKTAPSKRPATTVATPPVMRSPGFHR